MRPLASLLAALVATGCMDREAPLDEMEPTAEPMDLVADENGCHGTATLLGMPESYEDGRAEFGPYVFGHGRFCLHLDASMNRRAHLMVGTDRFSGEQAPITLRLERPDGTSIVDGWDVAIGHTDTKVFANLELAMDGGTVMDAVLVVDGAGVGSAIGVSLFDPLE